MYRAHWSKTPLILTLDTRWKLMVWFNAGKCSWYPFSTGARGGAVGWDTALQAGRSLIRSPVGFGGFFIDLILGRTMALGSTQSLTETNTRGISWGWWRPVRRADNLATFMCRLSRILRASTSWNPKGLSRPVMGVLYLYPFDRMLPTPSWCRR
jgi:hypothetical protein